MLPLLAALATCLLLLWGAYRLGQWSTILALAGTAILVPLAWRIAQVDISHGEGAPTGVAIVGVVVWSLSALSLLLAVAMLVGAIRAHNALVAKFALGLLILLMALAVVRRPGAGRSSASKSEAPGPPAPRASHLEGYAWAIDAGATADSACHGDSAFVNGCKAAVARNLNH